MNQRHYLIKGTFLLTLTGFLTKIAGFYYKIFLSRIIGAEQIGLFQLTAPVFLLCLSVSASGIQMAISRFTAEYFAQNKRKNAHYILACGLMLSAALALLCTAILWIFAPQIAGRFLLEERCAPLVRIIAVSLPFAVIHACIGGYFVGKKNVGLSAAAQMAEQLMRMGAVFLFYALSLKNGWQMTAAVMALGQVAGELSSALFCTCALLLGRGMAPGSGKHGAFIASPPVPSHKMMKDSFQKILSMSLPLTLTRMLLSVLQGIEAALLPQQLQRFGLDASSALTVYGTLTGMTLPLLLFPTAVTGALATLLMPVVSEAKTLHQSKKITGTVSAGFYSSLLLGYFFFTAFLLFGRQFGELLFCSPLAGEYICKLALICPFLYLNTTLGSILHGLGKTTTASLCSIAGFCIRLAMLILLVPGMGIDGYFAGMLFTQVFVFTCSMITLHRASGFTADLTLTVLKPGIVSLISGAAVTALRKAAPGFIRHSLQGLLLGMAAYGAIFLPLLFLLVFRREDRQRILRSIKI